jgi:hypothetical protein
MTIASPCQSKADLSLNLSVHKGSRNDAPATHKTHYCTSTIGEFWKRARATRCLRASLIRTSASFSKVPDVYHEMMYSLVHPIAFKEILATVPVTASTSVVTIPAKKINASEHARAMRVAHEPVLVHKYLMHVRSNLPTH